MNIFLPYPDINESIKSLDDRRLIKQILECKVLLDIALGKPSGYSKHPVSVHYKSQKDFLLYYGWECCCEYLIRFRKHHAYTEFFFRLNPPFIAPRYIPIYLEGSAIKETSKKVHELFRNKLNAKWKMDKIKPKWTNRQQPKFKEENHEE